MKINKIPSVLPDKLALTLQVSDKNKLKVKGRLLEVMESFRNDNRVAKHFPNRKRYGNNFKFKVPTDTEEGVFDLEISVYPQNKAHNFFRIEFNPGKLGSNGGQEVLNILDRVLGRTLAAKLYTDGRVTRLDLAVNIRRPLGDCFVFMKNVRQSEILFGAESEIESQILGSPKSNKKRLMLYNKAVEQGWDYDDEHWWRLEIVLRNLNCSVAELDKGLLEHFQTVSFYSCNLLDDDYFRKRFLNRVKKLGVNSALAFLDRNVKARYLRRLARYEIFPIDVHRLGFKRGQALLSFLNLKAMTKEAA